MLATDVTKRRTLALSLLLVLAVGLAGCTQPEEGSGDGNDTDGGDGNDTGDGGDGGATGSVTSVEVTDSPESVTPGEAVTVCWTADGEGNIPHVALHWGTESHEGDNVTFADYENTVYPDNESAPADGGYDLPGDFCTSFDAPATAQTVYYRAHAMVDAPGELSEEHSTETGLV